MSSKWKKGTHNLMQDARVLHYKTRSERNAETDVLIDVWRRDSYQPAMGVGYLHWPATSLKNFLGYVLYCC
jgi:hypothetical protein